MRIKQRRKPNVTSYISLKRIGERVSGCLGEYFIDFATSIAKMLWHSYCQNICFFVLFRLTAVLQYNAMYSVNYAAGMQVVLVGATL